MKSLLIIRHAKSSWDSDILSDFDRPLNERGKIEAPIMAEKLVNKGLKIDHFISSPAKRAKKTAKLFAKKFAVPEEDIEFIPALYHATPQIFFQVASTLKDSFDSVAIFSHNPGITEFANLLSSTQIDNMPTCSVFAVNADISSWKEFATAKKEFLFFYYPKEESGF